MRKLQTYRLPLALFFALLYMSLATQSGLLLLSSAYDVLTSPESSSTMVQTDLIICSGAEDIVISSPVERKKKTLQKPRLVINGLHIANKACSKCSKPKNKCCCNKKDFSQLVMDQGCDAEDYQISVIEKLLPKFSPQNNFQNFSKSEKKTYPSMDFSYHFFLHLSIDKIPIV